MTKSSFQEIALHDLILISFSVEYVLQALDEEEIENMFSASAQEVSELQNRIEAELRTRGY